MPAITYDEDVDFGVDLHEADIRKCTDIETLIGWSDDAEAVIEDIKGQIAGSALGGCAEAAWVYRAGKAMGFMARARARIKARLLALGWISPIVQRDLAELNRKLAEAKARNEVAVEFLRLCEEGGFPDRQKFQRLEQRAISLVEIRNKQRTEREAAREAA